MTKPNESGNTDQPTDISREIFHVAIYAVITVWAVLLASDNSTEVFLSMALLALIAVITTLVESKSDSADDTLVRTWRISTVLLLVAGIAGTVFAPSLSFSQASIAALALTGAALIWVTVAGCRNTD